MNLRFSKEAQQEADEASDWYERRQAGLGLEFWEELYRVLDVVSERPLQCSREETNTSEEFDVRRLRLKRFSYRVIFEVRATELFVLAVAHDARRPGYWASRIGDATS